MTETGESVVGALGVDAADGATSDSGDLALLERASRRLGVELSALSAAEDSGLLNEGPAREEVERWLTETLRRNLYSVSDINERLETFLPVG